ncbi:MAG: FecR family protein [Bacteroidales bacterium]|nr:FecR family protein [Bacteroidales bacterium]
MVALVGILTSTDLFEKSVTESIAPLGQKSQIILSDGSKVFLNSGSILRYDNHFGKRNREIELSGEAYFEVAKNKKIPFVITTSGIEIKVLGTKFNVMAYADEPEIITKVTEGIVKLTDLKTGNNENIVASQSASFSKINREITLSNFTNINDLSWKDNSLHFDNENFEQVIKKLERWYNVSIKLEGKDSIDDRFTLTIKDESLREVLDLIKHTTPLEYKISGENVRINL